LDSERTVNHIADALRQGGHEVVIFEGDRTLLGNLERWKPDICFNICEGHFGDGREAHVPSLLEMLRIPYTGSKVLTLALTLDKPMTKRVLAYHGLPTPPFQVFEAADELLDPALEFPLFVKPSREGTGMGVTPKSIVHSEAELRAEVAKQLRQYREPILVERFINGREVTLGVVGNLAGATPLHAPGRPTAAEIGRGLQFLPPLEVDLTQYDPSEGNIYSHRLKTDLVDQFKYTCPAPLEPELLERLQWLTAAAFRVTGCLDVARVDLRMQDDFPYILEVNPLPGLSPGISDLVLEADAAGIDYVTLVNMILHKALRRYGWPDS
jgi:D-alanine-D-alanine ligase